MEQVGDMKFIDFEDALDRDLGKVGTPKRDAFESSVDEAVYSYKLGEAIRKARLEQNLTQEELGERIGVKKAQISKLERLQYHYFHHEPCIQGSWILYSIPRLRRQFGESRTLVGT